MTQAGISGDWLEAYARVAERTDRENRYGLTRYPFESGSAASALVRGFFDNEEWTLRRKLSKQQNGLVRWWAIHVPMMVTENCR